MSIAGLKLGSDGADRHRALGEETEKNVVPVRADHQPMDGQPHPFRHVAGINVSEVSRRNGEGDVFLGLPKFERGGKVIDRLGKDPRPVDRVHRGERLRIPKGGVVEHSLYEILTIVEGAIDRKVMDVRSFDRRHLPTLDLGYPSLWVQDEDVDGDAIAAGLDGRRARIAGSGAYHRNALPTGLQYMIEEPAYELKGVVLKRKGRPVKEFPSARSF